MKPVTQLFREPIRTALALILLTAASAFMCLGWGVLRSAEATERGIEESFVTLARFAPKYSIGNDYDIIFNEETGSYTAENLGEFIMEYIKESTGTGMRYHNASTGILTSDFWDALRSGGLLREIYQQSFLSARVPGLRTVTSATSGSRYSHYNDLPYNRAVLIFTLTDFELDTSSGFCTGFLRGEVTGYPALHPDYEPRAHVELSVSFSSREDLEAAAGGLEIGKTYIVNMYNYRDLDIELRLFILGTLASRGYTVEDIDLSKIKRSSRDLLQYGEYMYDDMAGLGYSSSLPEYMVDYVDRCYSTVLQADGLTLAPLTGSLEEFLADPDNADWAEILDTVETQYSTVPVLGTDMLRSIYLFHENIAYVTSGRSFESADYAEGRRVCLISETLAQTNGLEVGDTISLDLYNSGLNRGTDSLTGGSDEYNDEYNAQPLYTRTKIQDTREYEIVGLYANTDQWSMHNYNLSPNTVLVPNASLAGLDADTDGDFLKGIVVENGSEELIAALFAEKGWPENLLAFFNDGYSRIADTMAGFMDSPRQLFLVAAAVFLTVLAAYAALFVTRQRRNAGLMLSLGAGRGRAWRFVFTVSMVPAALSCAVGAALGALYLNKTVSGILSGVTDVGVGSQFGGAAAGGGADFAQRVKLLPSSVIFAGAALLLISAAALAAASWLAVRRGPMKLMKK